MALIERARREPGNLLFWTEAYRWINGRPMVVPPALHGLYEDTHRFIGVRKPSQIGLTEYLISLSLWAADTQYAGRGVVLYALPTAGMAERISQVRFAKAINESPYLLSRARLNSGAIKGPSSVQRRAIGNGVVYFVGAEQETQFSGIDADLVVIDEYDLVADGTINLLESRTRSSRAPRIVVISTPTEESRGVSALYDRSDSRRYELECPSCGVWQTPSFEENVKDEAHLQ